MNRLLDFGTREQPDDGYYLPSSAGRQLSSEILFEPINSGRLFYSESPRLRHRFSFLQVTLGFFGSEIHNLAIPLNDHRRIGRLGSCYNGDGGLFKGRVGFVVQVTTFVPSANVGLRYAMPTLTDSIGDAFNRHIWVK